MVLNCGVGGVIKLSRVMPPLMMPEETVKNGVEIWSASETSQKMIGYTPGLKMYVSASIFSSMDIKSLKTCHGNNFLY